MGGEHTRVGISLSSMPGRVSFRHDSLSFKPNSETGGRTGGPLSPPTVKRVVGREAEVPPNSETGIKTGD